MRPLRKTDCHFESWPSVYWDPQSAFLLGPELLTVPDATVLTEKIQPQKIPVDTAKHCPVLTDHVLPNVCEKRRINQKMNMISYKKKRCFLAKKEMFSGKKYFSWQEKNQFLADFLKNKIFISKGWKKGRLVTNIDPFFETRH